MKHTLVLFMLSAVMAFNVSAQKLGYINTQELLSNMSEMKLADNQVQALQNDLVAKGEEMVIKFEADYKAYMTRSQ
ncbi:MAG: hypothetical protein IPG48_00290 [Saprospiraceae bacterium]|nr:hypothetical protein [Saprospiraceae bacterium]